MFSDVIMAELDDQLANDAFDMEFNAEGNFGVDGDDARN